jgi:hypothetical protein
MTNTQAYYATELITTVKRFAIHTTDVHTGVNVIKLFMTIINAF